MRRWSFQVAEKEALHAVARARELGIGGTWSAGVARHALGEALLARGHPRDAERELSRAVTLRQAGEPRLDTVHSLIQLARARVACGKLAAGRIRSRRRRPAPERVFRRRAASGNGRRRHARVGSRARRERPRRRAAESQPSCRFCGSWTPTCLCARSRRGSACRPTPSTRTFDESTPSSGRTPAKKRSRNARREGLIGVWTHQSPEPAHTGDRRRTTRAAPASPPASR